MWNVIRNLSGDLHLLDIEILVECDLILLKLVALIVQKKRIKKEGVKMIKHCKVCGKEMDCYDKKKGRSGRKNKKLAHNRITCSSLCSKKNWEEERMRYANDPKIKKKKLIQAKAYRERKKLEKKGM